MPEYICNLCNFSTKIKTQLARHEKTKKHLRNLSVSVQTISLVQNVILHFQLKVIFNGTKIKIVRAIR